MYIYVYIHIHIDNKPKSLLHLAKGMSLFF